MAALPEVILFDVLSFYYGVIAYQFTRIGFGSMRLNWGREGWVLFYFINARCLYAVPMGVLWMPVKTKKHCYLNCAHKYHLLRKKRFFLKKETRKQFLLLKKIFLRQQVSVPTVRANVDILRNIRKFSIVGLQVTSRRPCWRSRTKAFLSAGKWTLFWCKFSRKISFALTTNMAALSRGCKPRILPELYHVFFPVSGTYTLHNLLERHPLLVGEFIIMGDPDITSLRIITTTINRLCSFIFTRLRPSEQIP